MHNVIEIPIPRWYAVYTRSCWEPRVAGEMTLQGIDHYYPVRRELHPWADRDKVVDVPLFKGYVFCRMVYNAESRLKVLKIFGAVRIIGRGMDPEPIPNYEIDAIKRLLSAPVAFKTEPIAPAELAKLGSIVRVRRGYLQGVEGVLEEVRTGHRLVLAVAMLGQAATLQINAADCEIIHEPAAQRRRLAA